MLKKYIKRYSHQTTLQGFVNIMPHCGNALCIKQLRANAHKNQTKSENSGKIVKPQNRSNFGYQLPTLSYFLAM